jgi:hypothetical protein
MAPQWDGCKFRHASTRKFRVEDLERFLCVIQTLCGETVSVMQTAQPWHGDNFALRFGISFHLSSCSVSYASPR